MLGENSARSSKREKKSKKEVAFSLMFYYFYEHDFESGSFKGKASKFLRLIKCCKSVLILPLNLNEKI